RRGEGDAREHPSRVGIDGHANGVGAIVALVAEALELLPEPGGIGEHEVIDPVLEARAGLALHPARQYLCEITPLQRRCDPFVEEQFRLRVPLPVEDRRRGRSVGATHRWSLPSAQAAMDARRMWRPI